MSLQSFEVENYQALSHIICDRIPPLMVIAGPNGVGKSTLIHQLHQAIRRYQPSSNRRTGSCDITCEGETESVYFSPHRVPGNNSQFNRGQLLSERETRFSGLLSDDLNLPDSPRNLPTQRDPRGPDATAFRGLGRRMAEFTEERRSIALQEINDGEKVGEEDLPDVEQPLKDLVNRVVPGITLEGVTEENDNYRLIFRNRTDERVGLEDLSSGEIDMIVMLFFVAERQIEANLREYTDDYNQDPDKNMVVLIDGPESYLHPYLQYQFIKFISEYVERNSGIQIILVTHSDIILNNTPSENLWYLLYSDMVGRNQLRSATNIEVDLLDDLLGEMGTSALAAGRPLLLVEGNSDREVLIKLYPDIQDSMTILPMEGKKNIISIEKTLDNLISNFLENGMKFHAIIDRDRDDRGSCSSYIHKLPVTDIENTLLEPEALIKTVTSLASKEKLRKLEIETAGDVRSLLNDIVSREEIINEEIRLKINNELEFEVGMAASEELTEQAVLDRYDKAAESTRERIKDRYNEIVAEVREAADENNISQFKGKHIFGEFSGEFDLQSDSVKLLTAEYIHENGLHPDSIDKIISEIKEDLDL